jgi:hypothetical protein
MNEAIWAIRLTRLKDTQSLVVYNERGSRERRIGCIYADGTDNDIAVGPW